MVDQSQEDVNEPVTPQPVSQAPAPPLAPAPPKALQVSVPSQPAPPQKAPQAEVSETTESKPTMHAQNPALEAVLVEERKQRRIDRIAAVFFLVLVATVSWFLFLPNVTGMLFDNLQQSDEVVKDYNMLTIAYDQPLTTYEPTIIDTVTRGYLVNTYEGLVRFDRNFNIEPSLALSWGMLDDETWQFKLRPNVTFHDGSVFDAEDVEFSIERAQTHPDSEASALVSSIESVEVIDDLTVQITTMQPDPILLNRLTALSIVPSETGATPKTPIGTGPYAFARAENDTDWYFTRYDDYWGDEPAYSEIHLAWISDKVERNDGFFNGTIDVLAQVPPIFVEPMLSQGVRIIIQPSLQVNFLLFSWENSDSIFRHKDLRHAVTHIFDENALSTITSDYAHPINQFVSRGVFGYNPHVDTQEYDLDFAQELTDPLQGDLEVTLDLPAGLEEFGEYVNRQMGKLGIDVTVNIMLLDEYSDYIASGESEFYFLGWRSELGDAGNFFANVVHSTTPGGGYGEFNNGRYENSTVDRLIETMMENVHVAERFEQLQKLMAFVVDEEIIGIPLFETDVLVAVQDDLEWEPRIDNLIIAADFK